MNALTHDTKAPGPEKSPVKVLAMVTINDGAAQALARYLEITEPLLESKGAAIVERFSIEESIIGNRPAKSVIVVEYPCREAVDEVFASPEYRAAIPYRDAAFATYSIHIVE